MSRMERAAARYHPQPTPEDDAVLDRLIEAAVAPLRVRDADVASFDAGVSTSTVKAQPRRPWGPEPLPPERARRLLATLRRACAAQRAADEASEPALGVLIREGRARLHVSVSQVAQRLRVHRDYLAGLEAGERSPLALGAEGACRLVALLRLSPARAAAALEGSMLASLAPARSGAGGVVARMRRGVPKKERRRVLEAALGAEDSAGEAQEWRAMIDAVAALPEPEPDGL
jgi:transcriptional regulator with XRE-family HTH domain